MKIGFVVNDVTAEEPGYTTTQLGCEAVNRGHDAFVFGVGDIAYDPDEYVRARTRSVPKKLMLRNVPADDFIKRPRAATVAAEFGRVAMRHGVIVVNDYPRPG